jgi:hypothetical protein
MIAPYFAPQAAVGALRSVKLARNLPAHGFHAVVLSGTFPYDPRDEGLAHVLGPDVAVHDRYLDPRLVRLHLIGRSYRILRRAMRVRFGLDPFHSVLDRYAVHALHGASEAHRLGRARAVSLVYASLPPFSAAPVALAVARSLGVQSVLDLRDPWALHESGARAAEEDLAVRARAAFLRRAEPWLLARADFVVLNTERALAAHRAAYPFLTGKSACIPNAFDLGLHDAARLTPPDRFRIVHFGRLRADAPIDDIARGLRRFVDDARLGPADIELLQVGPIGNHERAVVERAGVAAHFRALPSVPQARALDVLRSAHILVVLNGTAMQIRINAKTFDYVGSGMPVLAISANAELDGILAARADNARVLQGDDAAIARVLAAHFARYRSSGALPAPADPPAALSAVVQAERMAAVFEACLGARPVTA